MYRGKHSSNLAWVAGPCPRQLKCPLSASNLAYIKMAVRSARTSMDADESKDLLPCHAFMTSYTWPLAECGHESIGAHNMMRDVGSALASSFRSGE